MTDYERGYHQGYADAMNWKTQNHLEHLPGREPQRQWVGLTDGEVQEIMEKTVASCTELDDITGDTARFTWRNIEAKLKEKNK